MPIPRMIYEHKWYIREAEDGKQKWANRYQYAVCYMESSHPLGKRKNTMYQIDKYDINDINTLYVKMK